MIQRSASLLSDMYPHISTSTSTSTSTSLSTSIANGYDSEGYDSDDFYYIFSNGLAGLQALAKSFTIRDATLARCRQVLFTLHELHYVPHSVPLSSIYSSGSGSGSGSSGSSSSSGRVVKSNPRYVSEEAAQAQTQAQGGERGEGEKEVRSIADFHLEKGFLDLLNPKPLLKFPVIGLNFPVIDTLDTLDRPSDYQ